MANCKVKLFPLMVVDIDRSPSKSYHVSFYYGNNGQTMEFQGLHYSDYAYPIYVDLLQTPLIWVNITSYHPISGVADQYSYTIDAHHLLLFQLTSKLLKS